MRVNPLILVVDDNCIFLATIRDMLNSEGFRVITATNAITAIFLLGKHNPDLILLDILMPNIDGYQTLEMIRLHSGVPVIMLTCLDNPDSIRQAMEKGKADGYINKPYKPGVLVARIRAMLRRTRNEFGEETSDDEQGAREK
ncbi:MAG: response regulator [Dehalococcoidales bacterium]|nr:response regulator [Dehalococcoidales bacterium]